MKTLLTQTIDQSDQIINFGYEYLKKTKSKNSLDMIVAETNESLIIYDTKDNIFSYLASNHTDFLNDKKRLYIGLISNEMIVELGNSGIKNGFYRSTKQASEVAIIISDKKRAFVVLNEDVIFEVRSTAVLELFQLINSLLWVNSDFEVINGSKVNEVESIRLSVVRPSFDKLVYANDLKDKEFKEATKGFKADLNLTKDSKDKMKNSILIEDNLPDVVIDDKLLINVFEDIFVPCNIERSFYVAKSFENQTYGSLVGKKLIIDGKDEVIIDSDKFEGSKDVPLEDYKNYSIDFKEVFKKELSNYVCKANLSFTVFPLKIDSKYKLSKNYQNVKNKKNELTQELDKLKKLFNSKDKSKIDNLKLKQIEVIEKEGNIIKQIDLYNNFIKDLVVGDKTLIEKGKDKFRQINVSLKDLTVPPEIIGKLYEKDNKVFLALKEYKMLEQGKVWLKEKNISASLVLDNE